MWHIGQNTSHVKNPTEFLTPIFAENIKCKISDLIGQTWGIRSNTSQMWTVWPNSTKLSHIQPNTSHVKNPTEFLTPIFANNVSCKIFDRLCQTWEIQWYTTRVWKNRPNSYKLWLIGQKTSHVKNATEFLTPLFTESVSPVWHQPKIAHVSNFIEFFTAVKNFHRIRHSHDIYDRIHHMWKIRPNFSHLYSPKISHVKYPTKYIKREEFDRILHRCEQLDLIRHCHDIFDRIHHMWKVRPNFSHLYSPIRPHVRCLTDYIKREKFNDILHRCGKIDRIHTSCDILDRKYHMWEIRPNFSHLYLPKISNVKFRLNMSNMRNMIEYFTDVNNLTKFVKVITYSAEYITCEKSDRISHTYILPKCVTYKKFDRICHLWGIRSNTLQLWNNVKIDLIRHIVVTHLTENITYENTFQFLTPIIHVSVSHVNTSDQIYLARDKFDRKLPSCKNNSTELFIVVTYLTKYMTCKKSDRISHTYISPKMFPFIKNLFTSVQAIEILMCDKLVWVKNSKSAKRILHLCPNVKNSVVFITPAWGIRSVRNTVQQSCFSVFFRLVF